MQDFAKMGQEELTEGLNARRNKIFLLMEEVGRPHLWPGTVLERVCVLRSPLFLPQIRRLRIQLRLRTENSYEEDVHKREYKSALPFLPPLVREYMRPPLAQARHCAYASLPDAPLFRRRTRASRTITSHLLSLLRSSSSLEGS